MNVLSGYARLRNVRPQLNRLIATVILLGWLAPGAGAVTIGLHLVSEHHDEFHGPHGVEHHEQIVDLARIAIHGHHHDLEAEPDHDHQARLGGKVLSYGPGGSPTAVLPASRSLSAALAARARLDRLPKHGAAPPLFTTHCALLL